MALEVFRVISDKDPTLPSNWYDMPNYEYIGRSKGDEAGYWSMGLPRYDRNNHEEKMRQYWMWLEGMYWSDEEFRYRIPDLLTKHFVCTCSKGQWLKICHGHTLRQFAETVYNHEYMEKQTPDRIAKWRELVDARSAQREKGKEVVAEAMATFRGLNVEMDYDDGKLVRDTFLRPFLREKTLDKMQREWRQQHV